MRRVVITGLGAVSALGNTVAETWEGIKVGRCGIEKITVNYDPGDDRIKIAAECKHFDPTAFMDTVRPILSHDTLKVLQILGFNYRKAIGEPLTEVVHSYVASLENKPSKTQTKRNSRQR